MKTIWMAFCIFLGAFALNAQIMFSELPVDMKLIPRDKDNMGWFRIAGKSIQPTKEFLNITLRNMETFGILKDTILAFGPDGSFDLQLAIPAMFAEFQLSIYIYHADGGQKLVEQVNRLVAGDYFIVGGQSNAAGSNGYDSLGQMYETRYYNKYCRSIGTLFERAIVASGNGDETSYSLEQECTYYEASSQYFENGCVASWPYRAMYEVAAQTKVPLCFVNAARGGTNIRYHLASRTPSEADYLQVEGTKAKPYDRTFFKLHRHKVLAGVKGILWFQGESDGDDSLSVALRYGEQFKRLYDSWKADYPSLQNVFVFQINTGCWGSHLAVVREQQRRLPEQFDDVVLMPAVGSQPDEKSADGCHYSLKGNEKLAEIVYPLILKHVYGMSYPDSLIMAPMIQRISYSTVSRICMQFDQEIDAELTEQLSKPVEGTVFLKDYFYDDANKPIPVEHLSISGSYLCLDLPDTTTRVKYLTYLPNNNSDLPSVYLGPWIVNKKNSRLGAFSFYRFPVKYSLYNADADSLQRTRGFFRVYPNPANDYLQVDWGETDVRGLRLLDLNGKLLMDISCSSDQQQVRISTAHLAPGVYHLLIDQPQTVRAINILIKPRDN